VGKVVNLKLLLDEVWWWFASISINIQGGDKARAIIFFIYPSERLLG